MCFFPLILSIARVGSVGRTWLGSSLGIHIPQVLFLSAATETDLRLQIWCAGVISGIAVPRSLLQTQPGLGEVLLLSLLPPHPAFIAAERAYTFLSLGSIRSFRNGVIARVPEICSFQALLPISGFLLFAEICCLCSMCDLEQVDRLPCGRVFHA